MPPIEVGLVTGQWQMANIFNEPACCWRVKEEEYRPSKLVKRDQQFTVNVASLADFPTVWLLIAIVLVFCTLYKQSKTGPRKHGYCQWCLQVWKHRRSRQHRDVRMPLNSNRWASMLKKLLQWNWSSIKNFRSAGDGAWMPDVASLNLQ